MDLSRDNCYDLLPHFKEVVLEDCNVSEDVFLDICLAICSADENVGTNRLELDIDKFFVVKDQTWSKVVGNSIQSCTDLELPKIQKLRVICDALIIVLRMSDKVIDIQFNSEASNLVANVLSVKSNGVSTYKDIDGIYETLLAIKNLYIVEDEVKDEEDKELVEDTLVIDLIKFIQDLNAGVVLYKSLVLPKSYEKIIGDTLTNVKFSEDVKYSVSLEKDFIKTLNDSVILELLRVGDLTTAFYIIKVKSVVPNKSVLCLNSDIYRRLFTNKRISNALSMLFNFSVESTSDIKSTKLLLSLMYCSPSEFTKKLFSIAKGGN